MLAAMPFRKYMLQLVLLEKVLLLLLTVTQADILTQVFSTND